ncbi:MAG: hypothetical protein ACYC1H_05035 [Rectinema subterraneum]|jgi:hypothetical protein
MQDVFIGGDENVRQAADFIFHQRNVVDTSGKASRLDGKQRQN